MNEFLFMGNNFLPRLIKEESDSSLHCIFQSDFCLEYVQYKNPSKERYQSIYYAINQHMFEKCDWPKRFDKYS